MDSKFGKGVSTPKFLVEHGAELEGWNRFIRRFEIAVIGAGLKNSTTRERCKEYQRKFEVEQRKAALLLDSMGNRNGHIRYLECGCVENAV